MPPAEPSDPLPASRPPHDLTTASSSHSFGTHPADLLGRSSATSPAPSDTSSSGRATGSQLRSPHLDTSPTHAEGLGGLCGDEIEMDSMPPAMGGGGGHRRRRSSLMNPGNGSRSGSRSNHQRSASVRAHTGGMAEEPKISEEGNDTAGGDESFSDEDLHDDEETGLTRKDRRRRQRKKERNTLLDQRIASERIARERITAEEKKEADQNVLQILLVNGSLILLWYLFSLSISLYNKWMFDHGRLNFPFPLFTTSVHMIVQFALASAVLYFVPSLRPQSSQAHHSDLGQSRNEAEVDRPVMTKLFYLTRIGPCGAATGLDIGLGNMSLKLITLTFYTMCKSSSLAFVLLFAFLFRLETPTWKLVAIIATMTFGVVMMVAGEVEFQLTGFILIISAAFFSGFRWGLTQILLLRHPATSNPFSSIFFLTPVMFLTLTLLAIPVEGPFELVNGLRALAEAKGAWLVPPLIIFPGCLAFLMTASEFALLQRTSVVTLSIAGIFKEVVTIAASTLVFDDQLTAINISGLVITIAAICAYNYVKISRMRREAQADVHSHHLEATGESSSSDMDSDGDGTGGEEAGLLEDSLVTADGDIFPKPDPSSATDEPGVAAQHQE